MQVRETLKELVMTLITIGGIPLAIIFILSKTIKNRIDHSFNVKFGGFNDV
jgi:preprotein translocase subunit SecY